MVSLVDVRTVPNVIGRKPVFFLWLTNYRRATHLARMTGSDDVRGGKVAVFDGTPPRPVLNHKSASPE